MVAKIRINPYGALALGVCIGFLLLYWLGGGSSLLSGHAVSVRSVLAVAVQLAERGGQAIREIRVSKGLNARSKGETEEGVHEILTDGDLRSHQEIRYGFAKAFPGLHLISEEHDEKPIDFRRVPMTVRSHTEVDKIVLNDLFVNVRDLSVWLDPLDATQEFSEDLLEYVSVMVCVTFRGHPIIGIIHQPFKNTTYWSWTGYGMSSSLRKLLTRSPAKSKSRNNEMTSSYLTTDQTRVLISRSHSGSARDRLMKTFGQSVELIPAGGSGYKALSLLSGGGDLYVHTTSIKRWDICAPQAILEATGGTLTTLTGDHIDYRSGEDVLREGILGASSVHAHRSALEALQRTRSITRVTGS